VAPRELEFWDDEEWKSLVTTWPKAVRKSFGARLRTVQNGSQPTTGAKPLGGFAISLWELKHRGGQRVVYTVAYTQISNCVHVLDAFGKDAREGSEMRKSDKKRIEGRVAQLKARMERLVAENRAKSRKLH
jgi:phage-related protein